MPFLVAAPLVACLGALPPSYDAPPRPAGSIRSSARISRRVRTPAQDHGAPRRKLLIVAVGQSNNGVTLEPGQLDPVLDGPDARILELSQGLVRSHFDVAAPGARHVFQDPAQDDRRGICMLPAPWIAPAEQLPRVCRAAAFV